VRSIIQRSSFLAFAFAKEGSLVAGSSLGRGFGAIIILSIGIGEPWMGGYGKVLSAVPLTVPVENWATT